MSKLDITISVPYPTEINYDLAYNELIGVAPKKFDMVSSCFIPEHFPIAGSGIVTTNIRYVEFDQFVETNEEVLDELARAALLPARTVHVAQFGIRNPIKQFTHPYIGLGTSWTAVDGDGGIFHPVLDRWTLRSYFGIVSVKEGGWKKGCRFLVLDDQ